MQALKLLIDKALDVVQEPLCVSRASFFWEARFRYVRHGAK